MSGIPRENDRVRCIETGMGEESSPGLGLPAVHWTSVVNGLSDLHVQVEKPEKPYAADMEDLSTEFDLCVMDGTNSPYTELDGGNQRIDL